MGGLERGAGEVVGVVRKLQRAGGVVAAQRLRTGQLRLRLVEAGAGRRGDRAALGVNEALGGGDLGGRAAEGLGEARARVVEALLLVEEIAEHRVESAGDGVEAFDRRGRVGEAAASRLDLTEQFAGFGRRVRRGGRRLRLGLRGYVLDLGEGALQLCRLVGDLAGRTVEELARRSEALDQAVELGERIFGVGDVHDGGAVVPLLGR